VIRRRPGLLGLGLAAPNKETPGSLSLRPASSSDWQSLLISEREALIPARDGQLKPLTAADELDCHRPADGGSFGFEAPGDGTGNGVAGYRRQR